MDIKIFVFSLISFAHDLFTVIWLGGLIVTVLSYMPAVKEALGPGPQIKKVMTAFQKRQSIWVYISIAGLILTGLVMSKRSPAFEHLFGFGNPYSAALSIKHILVILMIGTTLFRSLVLDRTQPGSNANKEKLNLLLLLVNVILALAVLFLSAFTAAVTNIV